jgi:hypothetical protein
MTHICPFFHPQAIPSTLTDYAIYEILSAVGEHTIRAKTFDDNDNMIVEVVINVLTVNN